MQWTVILLVSLQLILCLKSGHNLFSWCIVWIMARKYKCFYYVAQAAQTAYLKVHKRQPRLVECFCLRPMERCWGYHECKEVGKACRGKWSCSQHIYTALIWIGKLETRTGISEMWAYYKLCMLICWFWMEEWKTIHIVSTTPQNKNVRVPIEEHRKKVTV